MGTTEITIRIALYARVSTTRQETENQTHVLREFSGKSGDTIVREYVEEVTGSGLKKRDEFASMLQDAKRKKFDLVLFWSLDRFSREGPLKTLQHLELLTNYGVAWKSYTEQYLDSTGIFKDAIISILATIAKQERIRNQERIRLGLERARRQGKRFGRPPVGVSFTELAGMRAAGATISAMAKAKGIARPTVRRILARGEMPVSDR